MHTCMHANDHIQHSFRGIIGGFKESHTDALVTRPESPPRPAPLTTSRLNATNCCVQHRRGWSKAARRLGAFPLSRTHPVSCWRCCRTVERKRAASCVAPPGCSNYTTLAAYQWASCQFFYFSVRGDKRPRDWID